MKRSGHARALKGANGTCRDRRRSQGGAGMAWVRPFVRANRSLDASIKLIGSTLRTIATSERRRYRRPVGTSRSLREASGRLWDAATRLLRASSELAETNQCIAREPEHAALVPELVDHANERWDEIAAWLYDVIGEVNTLQDDVLRGLETGTLVAEKPAVRRPRIILAPRPAPIRAFVLRRQPRVVDRIAPILRRRRRTPRPAAVRVPRRSIRGRAPPLSSVCSL